jgi:PAS domain S-box-containing protein
LGGRGALRKGYHLQHGKPRILVIDDEQHVASMLRLILKQKMEAEVTIALTCESARGELDASEFDLVTVDYQMPDGDGLELLDEIASRDGHPPAIMVTGHGDEETAVEAFKRGAAGYVAKDRRLTTLLVEEAERAIAFRRAVQALREGEERYRLLYDFMGEATYTYDRDLIMTDVNKRACEIIGYDREKIVGRNVLQLDILHPDDLEKAARDIQMLFSGEPVVRDRYRFILKDGSERIGDVTGAALYDESGELTAVTNVVIDMTEQLEAQEALKKSEEDLRQSEERYRALFDQSPIGVLIFDGDLKITECNERSIEIFETSGERMIGRDLNLLTEKGVIPTLREALAGRVSRYEEPFRDEPSGMSLWISAVTSPLRNAEGRVIGGVAAIEDITERMLADYELRRVNEELSGYAQTVSHDLRGPIAAIQMAADTFMAAAKAGSSQEDLDEILDMIRENSEKTIDRIEGLLILAQAGQAPVDVGEVDVSAVVSEVLDDLETQVMEVSARVSVDTDLGHLRANHTQVYQVFSNLIANALKHNDKDRPEVEVRYTGIDEGGSRHYLVRDNGPGIPAGSERDIFKPFFKAAATEGTGIGLSIAERMVKAYNGEIQAHNEGGAVFEFSLKDAEPPPG